MKRYKCDTCGHVTKTPQGASSHIRAKHKGKGDYSKTRDPVTNPNRNGPHKTEKRKPAVPVITSKTEYIDVPCTLRVTFEELKVKEAFVRKS